MPKSDLKIQHKRFIVKLLAVYESPSEIIASVKEKFDVTVTRQQLQHYDPTTVAGADLSEELKKLFTDTRKAFDDAEIVPLSKQVVRMKKLSGYVEKFENMGNYGKAAEIIEQIAKDEGGAFTNRREISGRDGQPIAMHQMTVADWKKQQEERRRQAANTAEIFEEKGNENP